MTSIPEPATGDKGMYMRIAWGRLKPGHWGAYQDAFEAAYRDAVLPGLKARYLIQDVTQPDSGFSISIWETEADLAAYDRSEFLARHTELMKEHFTGVFNVQRCRIAAAHQFGSASPDDL